MPSEYEVLDALVAHVLGGPVHPDTERVLRAYQAEREDEQQAEQIGGAAKPTAKTTKGT